MVDDEMAKGLGRGLAQLNMKVGRLIEMVGQADGGAGEQRGPEQDILLDLVEDVGRALRRREGKRRGFFTRRAKDEDLWDGLELSLGTALERLGKVGIRPIAEDGEFDASLHRAVERVPGGEERTIAETVQRGWVQGEGGGMRVLRCAQVRVFGGQS